MKPSDLADLPDRSPGRTGPPPAAGPAGGQGLADLLAQLRPYPEYKDTGLPWLGKVPKHWKVLPNRALFFEVKEREHPDEEMLSVTITQGVIRQRSLLAETAKKDSSNLDKSAYKLVCPGDIAYNKMRAWQGAIGASTLRGIISPAYVVMRLRDLANLPRYFHFLFRTPHFAKEAERWSYGITSDMWSLRPEHFKMIYAPQPPPAEQAAIVRFLDWAEGRVERAVRAKRRLIALLQELKQVLIHRAVTGQVDVRTGQPYPAYKPSGLPWLGPIPEHWEVVPLKRVAWFKGGTGFPVEEQGRTDLEIPFLKVSDMTEAGNETWMDSANNAVSRETALRLGATIFPRNSIVFPKVGGALLTNKRRILKRPSCIDNNMMGAVVQRGRLEFVFLLLQQLDLGRLSNPGPVPAISEGEVREIRVAFPPEDEQGQIFDYCTRMTAPLTTALTRLEREIELLRELRTRLVADVVTGKLDVRALAERLPAEPPPAEAPPEAEAPAEEEGLSDESDWSDESEPATLPP